MSDGEVHAHRPQTDWLFPLEDFYNSRKANENEWLPKDTRKLFLKWWFSVYQQIALDPPYTRYDLLFAALVVWAFWAFCRFRVVDRFVKLVELKPPAWPLDAAATDPQSEYAVQKQILVSFDEIFKNFPRHAEVWKAMNFGDRNGQGVWNVEQIKQRASPDQDKQMPGYLLTVQNGNASVRAEDEERWNPLDGTKWDAVLRLKEGIDDLVVKYIESMTNNPFFGNLWNGKHNLNFNSLYTWMYYLREDFLHYVQNETIPEVEAVRAQPAREEEIQRNGRVRMQQVPAVAGRPGIPAEPARPAFSPTTIKKPRDVQRLATSPPRRRPQAQVGAHLPRAKSVHPSVVDEVFAMWRISKMNIA